MDRIIGGEEGGERTGGKGEKMGVNEDRGGERDRIDDEWIILDIYETMRRTMGRAHV